jgi:hypothetical protein
MTDTLRDLLHESVADLDVPDLADVAWRSGARARRRRIVSAVGGVAAVVLAVGGTVWVAGQRPDGRGAAPVHRPSPTSPISPTATGTPYDQKGGKPDAEYHGTSVWWAPSVAQEGQLPAYQSSPLPTTIDLLAPDSGLVGDPIGRALAAFAVYASDGSLSSVRVLGPDGLLRGVDLVADPGEPAPVTPMRNPEGNLRIRAGAAMLSPSGKYLMFPQKGSIRLLRLSNDQWSTIDTGTHATWDATWTDDDGIVMWNPNRPDATAPVYDVAGGRVARASGATDDLVPRYDGDPYGLPRRSPGGALAQSFVAGADVPQPPELHLSPRQSDWIGVAAAPDAVLVLPQESARQKECCQLAGWLDRFTLVYESRSSEGLRLLAWRMGTGRFWQVSRIVGWRPGEQTVVSSYARLYPEEECCTG